MERDWEKEKQKVWARVQKELGFYAPMLKEYLDKRGDDTRDIEDYESLVDEYLWVAKGLVASGYLPKPKRENSKKQPAKRYQRPFDKRLHLVGFIIERQLRSRKQVKKIRKTINWRDTCTAWNEAHPYDRMTPAVLKATFYRAITQEDLQREYIRRNYCSIDEMLWRIHLYGQLPKELVDGLAFIYGMSELACRKEGKPFDSENLKLKLMEMIDNPDAVSELELKLINFADPIKLMDLIQETDEIAKLGKYKKEVKEDETD